MKKNLTLNVNKLIWVRLKEAAESNRYTYYSGRPRKRLLGVTIQKELPPSFIDLHEWRSNNKVSREELLATGKYIINESNDVITKPHLRLLMENMDSCQEIFYDTYVEAEREFDRINSLLAPNILRCS